MSKPNLYWTTKSLEELIAFVIGGDWGEDPDKNLGEEFVDVVCIRGSEIRNWSKEKGISASIRKIRKSSLEKRKLREGDILLEISGGGPDQPVGRTVFIDKESLSIRKETPKVCSNFLRLIRLTDSVDKRYVDYYLQKFYLSGEVVGYQGGSNNLRNLKFKEYSKIKIPLAPPSEQKQISKKLDEIFQHIEAVKTRIDHFPVLIQVFKEKILTYAVTGKLTEEWRLNNQKNKSFEILNVKELAEKIQYGYTESSTIEAVGPKFLRITDIQDGKVDWDNVPYCQISSKDKEKYLLNRGDILFARTGATVGKSFLIENEISDAVFASYLIRIVLKKEYLPKYIWYFFNSSDYWRQILSSAKGIGQPNVNGTVLSELKVPIPSVEEQKEIVKQIESLFSVLDELVKNYDNLKSKVEVLPQSALVNAFKGKLVK